MSQGRGDDNAIAVVRRARELGINFIDTAEQYGTESVVGRALAQGGDRAQVVLSTKVSPRSPGSDTLRTAAELRAATEERLRVLQTDYLDILHLHGIRLIDYAYCAAELVPTLLDLKSEGKIRFLGITEAFGPDPQHRMLTEGALHDDCWDVMMIGFNLLNQSARDRIFPITKAKGIGTLDMFAVRRALSQPDAFKSLLDDLASKGELRREDFDADDPLGFLTADSVAESVTDAAYRFCRDEPGVDVVLSGTGNTAHLDDNARALGHPPLPPAITERLRTLFAGIDSVSGN
jgi:aryl-alcohol dehydrogenase-like predicted oxidoreductase